MGHVEIFIQLWYGEFLSYLTQDKNTFSKNYLDN